MEAGRSWYPKNGEISLIKTYECTMWWGQESLKHSALNLFFKTFLLRLRRQRKITKASGWLQEKNVFHKKHNGYTYKITDTVTTHTIPAWVLGRQGPSIEVLKWTKNSIPSQEETREENQEGNKNLFDKNVFTIAGIIGYIGHFIWHTASQEYFF